MGKRTRIKVCGMTRVADIEAAVELGVDAIGMILHATSPRLIDIEQAIKLRKKVPSFVNVVGVFVNAEASLINEYANSIGLDTIQLHGEETSDLASQLNRPHIKAIRVQNAQQVIESSSAFNQARGILLDPFVAGQHGGTGELLDESAWPTSGVTQAMILAGGLSPDNLYSRVVNLQPFAVDLNSGVEESPGCKSAQLLEAAIGEVCRADERLSNRKAQK